jgi:hypothetical protein
VVTSLDTPPTAEDFTEVIPDLDETVSLDTAVSLVPGAGGGEGSGGGMSIAGAAPAAADVLGGGVGGSERTALATVRGTSLNRPLAGAGAGKIGLGDNLEGVMGVSVEGGSGDGGSVDRITQEILRQLEKSTVLVAWVMDASLTMAARREEVIKRFDRIYHELEVLQNDKPDVLLTSIVAFGVDVNFITPKPTSDPEEIKKAVREIPPDEEGRENIFRAVKETCLKLRRYQTQSGRKLIIIAITDEKGDDPSLADDTIKLVRRNKTPVYILGPMAPFGRKILQVPYTEPESGEVFMFPIERGPETVQSERLSLPFWGRGDQFDLFPSGFGPYDLTRLARESGGIYFMFDDGKSGQGRYDGYDLASYSPDYETIADYRKAIAASPLRQAVLQAADDSRALEEAINSRGRGFEPGLNFSMADLNQLLNNEQQKVAMTMAFVDQALARLSAVEKDRPKESSKRWQAHYDLMMGRLLANKVRCNEYNWATAQMKVTPKAPEGKTEDNKPNNAWRLVPDEKISFGMKDQPDKAEAKTNVKKSDPKATAKAKEDAEKATEYLQRVVKEHSGTPWALMAARELEIPMGFRWESMYIEPPQPNSNQSATQMAERKKREDAAKRLPKGL